MVEIGSAKETEMNRRTVAIQQLVDWRNIDLGTHYALIVDGEIVGRAVGGTTLADLQRAYRAAKAA